MSETENISIAGIRPFHSGAGTWTLLYTSKGVPGFYNPLSRLSWTIYFIVNKGGTAK